MMKASPILLFLICSSPILTSQETIPLWTGDIPHRISTQETETEDPNRDIRWITRIQEPTIEVYLPSRPNRTGSAILICPGGGYAGLAYDWEGTDVAKWLNAQGIAGIVLKNRVPKSTSLTHPSVAPISDAQRAMRIIRNRAQEWDIDPDQIGVMGFSAGGHLASTLGTQYDRRVYPPSDAIDKKSARPDFMILVYPVITFDSLHAHMGSRENLIGKNAVQDSVDRYSSELHVKQDTPPTLLVHSADDQAVSVENSLLFYRALIKNKVKAEMHLYEQGGHGYSLAIGKGHLASWTDRVKEWLVHVQSTAVR